MPILLSRDPVSGAGRPYLFSFIKTQCGCLSWNNALCFATLWKTVLSSLFVLDQTTRHVWLRFTDSFRFASLVNRGPASTAIFVWPQCWELPTLQYERMVKECVVNHWHLFRPFKVVTTIFFEKLLCDWKNNVILLFFQMRSRCCLS